MTALMAARHAPGFGTVLSHSPQCVVDAGQPQPPGPFQRRRRSWVSEHVFIAPSPAVRTRICAWDR
ncbi:hypothetical protein KCP76_03570 [Salmonella enterica subsp. enterica serovar Weltevreden]|nr:hypothetical protein KCP76_03570 [Salmonella enterica subsp. enterica serovar Weltevreden]